MEDVTRRSTTVAVGALCCAIAAAAIGCGAGDDAALPVKTITLSVPLDGALAARGRDMADAARLALDEAGYDTPDVKLELRVVDSRASRANAKAAAGRPNSVAYIGDLTDAATREAYQATRATRLLQISLAPSVRPGPEAVDRAPRRGNLIWLLPSALDAGRAYADQRAYDATGPESRVVVGTSAFARAAAAGLVAYSEHNGIRAGIEPASSASERSGLTARVDSVPSARTGDTANPRRAGSAYLMLTDDPAVAAVPRSAMLISPALRREDLPPAGTRFLDDFAATYDREPDRFAIFAYEAIGLTLDALTRAGEHGAVDRAAVSDAAGSIIDRFGPVGHYDVLPSGHTTLYQFSTRVPDGRDDPGRATGRVIEVGH
ncbi:MAG: hypothetical protein WAO61_03700 [Solirubrobacterales bacterium]